MRLFKNITTLLIIILPYLALAQKEEKVPPPHWQHLDLQKDNTFGISTDKAYKEILKDKKGVPVTVAVIDGGVDVNHPDLKDVLWTNKKEIPGNGLDDDKNGYVDDIHGWNFIGSEKGNVQYDNLEMVRLYRELVPKFGSALVTTPFSPEDKKKFVFFNKLRIDYMAQLSQAQQGLQSVTLIRNTIDTILVRLKKVNPNYEDFSSYRTQTEMENRVLKVVKPELKKTSDYKKFREELDDAFEYYTNQIKYNLNIDYDPRSIVGDNYSNSSERYYGNNDVTGPDAKHGTHVAGIIAASRNNGIGINGVANNVRIMGVRTVPAGDERDKDVANAIRYAVDNGASIINMSFGKSYVKHKAVVDSAVRYAVSKDVLLIHAAGNDGKNTDKEDNFPTRNYTDTAGLTTGTASAWIEVGASGWINDEELVADFSNYGSKAVDVFAPGVKINSTYPNNLYKDENGTSMAAPVVAGLAALIRSYYPKLSANQVKEIILASVTKVDQKVKIKEDGASRKVNVSEISVTGGVVNAYNALLLASKKN